MVPSLNCSHQSVTLLSNAHQASDKRQDLQEVSLKEVKILYRRGTYETRPDIHDILRHQEDQRIHLPRDRNRQFRWRSTKY
jgi:hypothetical protein